MLAPLVAHATLTQAAGDPALLLAVRADKAPVVSLILSRGAKLGCANSRGVTALHEAARQGFVDTLTLLLQGSGKAVAAAVAARDKDGRTPLHYAAGADRAAAVRLLARAGADLDARDGAGRTALHTAAYTGSAAAAAALLALGADHSVKDAHGDAPLHDAAAKGRSHITQLLFAHGADAQAPGAAGVPASHLTRGGAAEAAAASAPVAAAAASGDAAQVRALVAAGQDVNRADRLGRTALMNAASRNDADTVRMLLSAGAVADIPDKEGNTALHFAAGFGASEAAQALLDGGANMHAYNQRNLRPHDVVPLPAAQPQEEGA